MATQHQCYPEIVGQHEAWQQAVKHVQAALPDLSQHMAALQPDEVIFLACGSPHFLGLSASLYWRHVLGIPARSILASELMLYPDIYLPPPGKKPLVVVVSRSGATSEVRWALEKYEARFPGRTLFVGCAPDSPLAAQIEHKVLIPAAYEQTVPQTRSFASMFLATQLIAALIGGDSETAALLEGAPAHAQRVIAHYEEVAAEIASRPNLHNAFFLGSGPLHGVATEAALKMAEMSLTEAFSYPFLESRHGPRSLIDERTLVVGMFGQAGRQFEPAVITELIDDSQAHTVALTPSAAWDTGGAAVPIPVDCEWPDAIQGLSYLPVLHLLAYYRAISNGVNPDESRNLVPYVELSTDDD